LQDKLIVFGYLECREASEQEIILTAPS